MQVEIGGMDRKISETTWKFFMLLCDLEVDMNGFTRKYNDFYKTCTKKSDNLNVKSRAREYFLCPLYDHSYLLHFNNNFVQKE